LSRVAAHQEKNKMDSKNLAIVFVGVVFGEDEIPKGLDILTVQTWKVFRFYLPFHSIPRLSRHRTL
jgi:hypothetical protein